MRPMGKSSPMRSGSPGPRCRAGWSHSIRDPDRPQWAALGLGTAGKPDIRIHTGQRKVRGFLAPQAYAANLLIGFDPATRRFTEIQLPIRDAVPYVVRAEASGALWIGTSAADALLRYDPAAGAFEIYHLPSRGALIRHLAVDPQSRAVWAAYGAAVGIPARIARVHRR